MEVKLLSSTTLSHGPSPHVPSSVPLTIFDHIAADMHVAVLFAFSPPTPSNASLTRGLSDTLLLFPTLASRLGEDPPCFLTGHGVLLVEAEVDSELIDHVPFAPSRDLSLLHPPEGPETPAHMMQVQLNRFRCGGLVVGITAHHRVADGWAIGKFVSAWGEAVRGGLRIDEIRPLVYDQSWLRQRSPPRCEFEHMDIEFKRRGVDGMDEAGEPTEASVGVSNVTLHFSWEFITEELKGRTGERQHTTFQVLLAHLWRKITIARRLDPEEFTYVGIGVNCRQHLNPPVPKEYFGNVVLNAYPRAKVQDLLDMGIAGAARLIQDAVSRIHARYIQSFIDFGAMHAHKMDLLVPVADGLGTTLRPNLEVNSWLGLRFLDFNFGAEFGGLLDFVPSWIHAEGVIVLVPAVDGKGVKARVTLMEEEAVLLKEIAHIVD